MKRTLKMAKFLSSIQESKNTSNDQVKSSIIDLKIKQQAISVHEQESDGNSKKNNIVTVG